MLPGKRTNDGALYVTQGPPPAGTPLVGGIAVSHTGVIYVSQSFVQPFTPADLFKLGEQGAWYDPSDLSTMFQDSAGTTPVTADGQPVGLILDKSKGLVLGPEGIPDSNFDSPAAWTPQADWTVSGGKATYTDNGNLQYLQSVGDVSFVIDQWYKLSFTISGASGTSGQVTLGLFNKTASVNLLGSYISYSADDAIPTNGAHTIYFKSPATTTGIRIYGNPSGSSPSWSLENFSIQSVAGNHASQATAASRPLYKTDGTYHWLQFDGVDDYMVTGNIDKSAWTGGIAISGNMSLSGNSGPVLDGARDLAALQPHEPFSDQTWYGTFGNNSRATLSSLSVSTKYVLSRLRSATTSSYRKNAVAEATTSAGATNFGGNSPIYVGNGTAVGTPFKGNVYSLIVLGRIATTQEITDTETWVNTKTGAY